MKRTINGREIEVPPELVSRVVEAEEAVVRLRATATSCQRLDPAVLAEVAVGFEIFGQLGATLAAARRRTNT